jgi:hypothetical protein
VNSQGTRNGNDLTFVPGGAVVATTAASGIGLTSATAGGNVTADGGSGVTAKGTCWSTSANPTIGGSHTTDGSGLGVFTSSLTGLTSSTLYHIRAYATNGNGTFYGDDLTFTTNCGIYTLSFSESFPGATIPTCWGNIDNIVPPAGQVWQFGVVTSETPLPALTGNYAYLNSDAYGSGNTQNADLVTPTIDMTGFTNITLQFNHYFKSYSGSSATLSYSITNGSTWTQIQQWTATTTNPLAFNQVIAALAGQSQVKIKWNYIGSFGYYWAIDDVSITGTPSGPSLSVTPPNQNVPATPAGTTTFSVTSNSAWTVVSDSPSWCTIAPASGSNNGTLMATYTVNTLTTPRTATITTTVAGISPVTVTVTQAGATPTLTVLPANQNVPATPAGSTSFAVTSNSSWTVVSDQAWAVPTPSGSGNGTINVTYSVNAGVVRVANITTTVAGIPPVTVTVSQGGIPPTLTVTPPNQNVPATPAGTTSFAVTSNTSWSVVSDQAWATVTTPSGSGNGTITVNYTVNGLVSSRVANITTTVAGLSPVVVTVTQQGATPALAVTPPNQNVTAAPAATTNFTVTSNTTWTASSDQSWCTVTPSGSGNGTIVATYTENTSLSSRMATITVTGAGIVSPVTVTVTQSGATPTLVVTPPNQNVTSAAGNTAFAVTSNSAWTASSDQAWCTVTPSGSGNGTITAVYTAHPVVGTRVATITVIVGGIPPVSVTVTQAGIAAILVVSPSNRDVTAAAGSTSFTVTTDSPTWTAVCDASWCTVTPSGAGNGTIVANYLENTNTTSRMATITVSAPGLTSQTATITQAGAAPTLAVSPPNQNVTAPAGSTSFNVMSNSEWNASSDETWCMPTPSGTGVGIIAAVYTENTIATTRVATLTVTVSGLAPVMVTVTQLGTAPALAVAPPSRSVTRFVGTTNFTVTSNANWTTYSDASWCAVTPGGTGSGPLVADYLENTTNSIRTAHITVTVSGIAPVIVTVIQDGTVGVADHQNATITIIPNPASGLFRVVPGGTGKILQIDILDLSGRIMLSRKCTNDNDYQFDLANAAQGCYFVRVTLDNAILVRQLIINK